MEGLRENEEVEDCVTPLDVGVGQGEEPAERL